MAGQTVAVWDSDAAKDKLSGLSKTVGIIAVTDTQVRPALLHYFFGQEQILRTGYLDICFGAFDKNDRNTCLFEKGCLIGHLRVAVVLKCLFKEFLAEGLRGLCLPERGSVDGGGDSTGRVASLQGVFYRYRGNGCTIFQGGKIASVDDFATDQRPGAIMDEDDVRIVGTCLECLQPGPDRILTPASAGHYCQVRHIDGIAVE